MQHVLCYYILYSYMNIYIYMHVFKSLHIVNKYLYNKLKNSYSRRKKELWKKGYSKGSGTKF